MIAQLRRRAVLGLGLGAAFVTPFAAKAAGEPAKVFRLGMPLIQPRSAPPYRAFEERLHELGYEDGRNLHIDFVQVPGGDLDR